MTVAGCALPRTTALEPLFRLATALGAALQVRATRGPDGPAMGVCCVYTMSLGRIVCTSAAGMIRTKTIPCYRNTC